MIRTDNQVSIDCGLSRLLSLRRDALKPIALHQTEYVLLSREREPQHQIPMERLGIQPMLIRQAIQMLTL